PFHEDYSFTPLNKTYTQLASDHANQNFAGTAHTYTISGYIKDGSNTAIVGSTVTLSGGATATVLTDTNGYYEFTGLLKANYITTASHEDYTFAPSNQSYNQLNSNQSDQNFIGTEKTYIISGYIKDTSNIAIVSSTITLSGGVSATCITDTNGYYEFTGLLKDDYTITPFHEDYSFSPLNKSYTQLTSDHVNQNFAGTPHTYTISGYIKDGSDVAIVGSTVTLSGGAISTCITDSNGYYEFTGLVKGDYTITSLKENYGFTPPNKNYNQLNINQINQNFIATENMYTISGYVKDGSNVAIIGSTVTLSDGASATCITDSSGYYEFTGLIKADYAITSVHEDYSFNPLNKSYTQLTSDQINQDFAGTTHTYTICGYVKDTSNSTIFGSSVTLSGTASSTCLTDSNGYYEFTGLVKGDYAVTPLHENYGFTPVNKNYTQLDSNQTSQNFVANEHVYIISGYIQDGNNLAISGSTVTLSGGTSATVLTDTNGYYEFIGLLKADYTITPVHEDYSFNPINKSYTQLASNQTNQNFVGAVHTYTISGYVKDASATAISGSTVTLSGGTSATVLTDTNGYYEFTGLVKGDYVTTPFHNDYSFTPLNKSYTQLASNQVNQNFVGTIHTYTICGYVKDTSNSAIFGSTVTLSGTASSTCLTDINGYYEFTGLVKGDYTTTPSLEHYSFSPVNKTYVQLKSDQTDQNFIASLETYTISGYVKDYQGNSIVGSTVTINIISSSNQTQTKSNNQCITDSKGYYEFTELIKDDYVISCTNGDCSFSPSNRTYTQLSADQTNQNFTAEQPIISVDTELLDYGTIKKGDTKTLRFTITNTNNGTLSGNITADKSWIKLSPASFTSNNQIVDVTINSLETDGHYTGIITIESNGGTVTINVKIEANCVLTKPNPYNPNKHNGLKFYGSG
ncbi:carboxypeptidase regulatory-like domain-containing protein, partial [bacterium]